MSTCYYYQVKCFWKWFVCLSLGAYWLQLMPDGVRGLMLSVMMSALISSLTSVFNSISTIFTIDVWQRLRKKPSDMELMLVGRVAVMVLIVISILSIPVVRNVSGLGYFFPFFFFFFFLSSCCSELLVCFLLLFGWMGLLRFCCCMRIYC